MAGGDTIWRSVFAYRLRVDLPTSTVGSKLVSATMNVSHYSGTTSSQPVASAARHLLRVVRFQRCEQLRQRVSPILDSVKNITTGATSFNVTSKVNAGMDCREPR